ncbi:carboxypeptidase M32 [Paenibacillus sp. J2TS4]|uniref:carboxypeptidase M32 n=1 Tax=Paenibacillus sp. J2TS4 TaxID=2807194 RepID=UPI001B269334|nr:carboxypeptidase M32 [Paenibacillus sp. J2TS4]GIP32567.1 carboxypeptidase M32 [Paenibacillus sp. J2TS4]
MGILEQQLEEFHKLIKKMNAYEEAIGLMHWDLRTGAPKKAVEGRSEVIGQLSGEMFRLSISDEMGAMLHELSQPHHEEQLNRIQKKMIAEAKKQYDRDRKIPPDLYQQYIVLTSQAESVWEEAKEASDFAKFRPYLEKIVATNREFIELWGGTTNPYDTLLDIYEPGMTVQKLDHLFGALREQVVPLVAAIQKSEHQPDTSFLRQTFDKERQRQFNLFILKEMGYDLEAGRLDETVHPFAIGLNPGDVRITTKFVLDDLATALFGTIHEGGHALYEQNITKDLMGTNLCTGTSMGIHESQSRFWENMVGRSQSFWHRYYGDLQQTFSGLLDHVPQKEFYRAINEVRPSLIRTESDEVTYNLHIMIRYEIEKALFEQKANVADLPELWNEKYKDYLGVVPAGDGEGVLQDVHWAGGMFGYFPSYALGNMYAAQIRHTLLEQMPDFEDRIAKGELHPIKEWLTERVYQYGKLLDPGEIILQVTGEELSPNYLVRYLEDKYKPIYKL